MKYSSIIIILIHSATIEFHSNAGVIELNGYVSNMLGHNWIAEPVENRRLVIAISIENLQKNNSAGG